jgi:hypothetical protein
MLEVCAQALDGLLLLTRASKHHVYHYMKWSSPNGTICANCWGKRHILSTLLNSMSHERHGIPDHSLHVVFDLVLNDRRKVIVHCVKTAWTSSQVNASERLVIA